jgi:protease II
MSMDSPEHGWKLIRAAEEDVKYKVEHHTDYFYLLINHGNASNFKVLRAPVYLSRRNPGTSDDSPPGVLTESLDQDKHSLLGSLEDEIVIEHDPKEYIQRFSVFVRHFVAWIWRDGLQEIRVYAAPRSGDTNLPLKEVQRIRPYNKDVKVATVMPYNTRSHDQRLFMDFYSTKLWYSNCSYVHPWAIYQVDMDLITPAPVEWRQGNEMGKDGDKDERLRNSTSLVCQDPFPLGVRYGGSLHQQSFDLAVTDIKTTKDHKKKQKQAIAKFREQLLMVPSRHGDILIPVSLVYHVLPSDKQFPRRAAFVKAYGAYGTMTTPDFDPQVILPLLHRGLLFVHIHPRGDGNLGPQWYANGKAEHKLNTFYDVEDVLLYLRDSGMVEKEGIVMEGRSAGGLVSGWIANRWGETSIRQPFSDSRSSSRDGSSVEDLSLMNDGRSKNIVREMVRAVLAQVPFLDVIADMSDPDIPWVEYEWAEWGSPLESREVYEVMKAYSPYDRIRNQHYPAMMVMGGLTDGRVSYTEPLKFVAKLRSVDGKTNDCQPAHDKGGKDSEEESQDDALDGGLKGKRRGNKGSAKMCAGKKDTPLLLQMENGGHFSGNSSLWMAFGLYHLAAEDVITV